METHLQIRHIGYEDNKPQFVVVHGGYMKQSSPVLLVPPEQTIVDGSPGSNLQQDLRWYLEQFLELPLGGYIDTAERVQTALENWGKACFENLFQKQARDWFQDARRNRLENLHLKIASNDPTILAWPWEALNDPEGGPLAHRCLIERQLDESHDPLPLPEDSPKDSINILLVIARPYGDSDVGYHALSRPLVKLIHDQKMPVRIDVLRPPTFNKLRQTLHDKRGFYHIVHFDGHGGYGEAGHPAGSQHIFKGTQGKLIFEDVEAEEDPIEADKLSQLIAEYRIPIMVLNACQSARIDERAEDAFASVAAALLRAGIHSVVAMGYNLYVSGAQQFVPAFYQRLFESSNVSEATRAGRQAMLANDKRVCLLGEYSFQDWLVPVLYQQLPVGEKVLPQITVVKKTFPQDIATKEDAIPGPAQDLADYGFIGRERAVQALERARLQQPQAAFLIHGMAGIGKTTLAKGFLHWLRDTNGLGTGVFWFSFDEICNAEFVINELVDALLGTNARANPLDQRLDALVRELHKHPFLLVWDNFESASGIAETDVTPILNEDDRNILKKLIGQLRGGPTKILITSRSPERWLTSQEVYPLPLFGLQGEELWEYSNAVIRDFGLKIKRDDKDFLTLINELGGHPLAIRVILLRLANRKAEDILIELKEQYTGIDDDESMQLILATLGVLDLGVSVDFKPVLQLIGLHDRFVDENILETMAKSLGDNFAVEFIPKCIATLENAGLLQTLWNTGIYQMHPALRSHLTNKHSATEKRIRAFVTCFGNYASNCAGAEFHEQRIHFHFHSANFHQALKHAQQLSINQDIIILTQNLAEFACNTRDFEGSTRLYATLATEMKRSNNLKGEAVCYHQLGIIALEQNNYSSAESWYKKSLEISKKQGDVQGKAKSSHELGRIAFEQDDFSLAESWYNRSLKMFEILGDKHGEVTSYHQLGIIALEQNNYSLAESLNKKSLNISKKQGYDTDRAKSYYQLGNIALEQNNFSLAERRHKKSLEISEKLRIEYLMVKSYQQLGKICQEQHDFSSAENWYKQSLLISNEQGYDHDMATSYYQLGKVALEQGNFSLAESWCRESLAIYDNLGDGYGKAMSSSLLTLLEQRKGK
jgi:tetratricopeptide (TPR) repeat protein